MTAPGTGPGAYSEPLAAIRTCLDDLAMKLHAWERRDDTRPQPDVRHAANQAMDDIDAALAGLHGIRSVLHGEIRDSDDATAARADELLRRVRGEDTGQ